MGNGVYEKILCTRKNGRATAKDYIHAIFTDFMELHGDRRFGDDHAVMAGIAMLDGKPVTVVGIEKGHGMADRVDRNFGCTSPEGYRKALRLMKEAEKFHRPVICFVDTQGASCGMGAEERGEGQAIAENMYEMMALKTPILTLMIGEGSSGGAIALAVANEVWMLENAYYTVVSPEACASILFKDASRAADAAEHLKLSADDLLRMNIIERKIAEPADFTDIGQSVAFMEGLQKDIVKKIGELSVMPEDEMLAARYEKYRKIGRYEEIKAPVPVTKKKNFFAKLFRK